MKFDQRTSNSKAFKWIEYKQAASFPAFIFGDGAMRLAPGPALEYGEVLGN